MADFRKALHVKEIPEFAVCFRDVKTVVIGDSPKIRSWHKRYLRVAANLNWTMMMLKSALVSLFMMAAAAITVQSKICCKIDSVSSSSSRNCARRANSAVRLVLPKPRDGIVICSIY